MARASSSGAGSSALKTPKPKKTRWYHQVWQAYQMTRKQDPAVTWIMLGVFVTIVVVAVFIGLAWGHPIYTLLLGLPFALLAAMFVLARRAESAAYGQIEGQPGASRAALGTIRRGWNFPEEPVAVDPRTQDLVFRGVGRAGVVLVGEGPASRIPRLLEAERKRTARVLPNVPITLIQCGIDEGQVPLKKLPRTVQKLKPKLTKQEVSEVIKRLTALGAVRLPVPKGIDPMRARPDRKGMRGR
ncbi:DUF4191 domain-containing protein [Cellulomonas sp. ATA003]|uniref:DUF4191 domain-containing protein n=1 Tax=Cellulomonas sp. ATA003 TaxID=3073064 RepID=UPI0028734C3D|nr:DUF4191 domain-containing protein [Cellulomonas sp. ATA003]WNB84488.1 DUF4191 domain-containing protein [Cellulomonas sp. ATA003]